MRYRCVIIFVLMHVLAGACFLSTDPWHQFGSLYDFVGNQPTNNVDRNGKGWENAAIVDMGHYNIEIDFSQKLHARQIEYHGQYGSASLSLNQYSARAMSFDGVPSESFRVSVPARFDHALSRSSNFLKGNNISNCSSFALGTNEKGFLITSKSTPLPILEHPGIYDALMENPKRAMNVYTAAKKNDIVTEYMGSTRGKSPLYFHTVRITHAAPGFNVATYVEKNHLQGNAYVDTYVDNPTRLIRAFRPKPQPVQSISTPSKFREFFKLPFNWFK